jgi:D-glycero-D-manno-heptose 1,7-bisphosphate phosphatase
MVILDRDGTLVIDRGYMSDPAELEFAPGAAEALQWWHRRGHRLLVISNQSGVGRGFFSRERVEQMNARLHVMVAASGGRLERIYYCPHRPDAECNCRKPALGLLRQAQSELGFDPHLSVVIGDRESDIEFGRRAGAKTILIANDSPARPLRIQPDRVAPNLLDAARAMTSLGW